MAHPPAEIPENGWRIHYLVRCPILKPIYPLVMTNIATEHGPFIDASPIKNGDFPWLC